MTYIRLDKLRAVYKPQLPEVLEHPTKLDVSTNAATPDERIAALFPHTAQLPVVSLAAADVEPEATSPLTVGVLLSGGQAPGGHNVIAGIFDALKMHHPASILYGFIMGPGGLLRGEARELTADVINRYRNTGGFDMIGSDRTKLETKEQFEQVLLHAHRLALDALVVIGGDDSNTNAALLAEYCRSVNDPLCVVGCPKTIDGDLKNGWVAIATPRRSIGTLSNLWDARPPT